ncbi:MAG TPA: penicillin acylase family protein [Candidatus Competibacteraceae bacterium]|nr:penicillin acylase family protein [Candidatus Competibacteraceae bacterium]HRZ05276.1 penicillin acylase family protein [Candidatus Competibacteraceae bacterium]HSA46189.1 penicillin acylase family protein [Candidatus Competibacteraceae bacterium]
MTENSPWRRRILWSSGILLALLVGAVIGLYILLHGSLPLLDGTTTLSGLSASVAIERDALGIPAIRGINRLDVARATGFVHAQERFFQMDLTRRRAAGELAELFGTAALEIDRTHRVHRLRHRAQHALVTLPTVEQVLIAAYTEGVNAGLAALSTTPFEYGLLRTTPQRWRPEDTLLVVYAMYLDLQDQQWPRESARGLLHDQLPPVLAEFLDPVGTEWDAPLQGEPLAARPPPGPDVFNAAIPSRQTALAHAPPSPPTPLPRGERGVFVDSDSTDPPRGSNNWAVAGHLTNHGGAMLANDMHLTLRVPNVWYRATFLYPDTEGRERRISGVTLPGTPALVAGSNGHLAWGYTNSEGDWADLVLLESGESDDIYRTPDGPRPFQTVRETITVKDAPAETLDILETVWGPVLDRDHQGRRRVLRWVAHDPQAVNLGLLALEEAETLETALDIAHRVGMPAQNLLLASADGRIAWTLTGPIPRRFGHNGRLPSSWADGQRGWSGWLEPADYPQIVDPPSGRLWTANGRVVDGAWLAMIGDGGYALGARARQIRDGLLAREQFAEADFLALQLDDRALFLERWRTLLLATLTPEWLRADPRREALRNFVLDWGGRATPDSVGYRAVRAFRLAVRERAFAPLIAPCQQADPRFDYSSFRQHEGPLWQLVSRQPPHLLDPRYADWPALLQDAADATLAELIADGRPLATKTWGDAQPIRIQHPFSRLLPWLSGWLDMPTQSLPGDLYMPRVQTPTNGASERLVVAPGREATAILHAPGGQSGHPLSPYYRTGHDAWTMGRPTPLEPGSLQHRLTLQPELR